MLERTATDLEPVDEHVARERRQRRARKHDALALLGLVVAFGIVLLLAGLWVLSA